MAVIDKNKASQTKSDTEEKDGKKKGDNSGRIVDLLQDKSLPSGAKRKHDVTEDAWEYSAPPKAGKFSIKLHRAKDGETVYEEDRNGNAIDPIYSVAIEGEIVNTPNGEYDKVRVFPRVSTAVGRGKNISTTAGLIHKLGFKVPDEIEDKALATLMVKALMKEPVIDVEIDWQAYSKEDKRVVYRGMHKFPQDENGEPMWIIDYKTKAGVFEEIRATLEVVHWYGKGEQSKENKGAQQAQSKKTETLTLAAEPDEEEPPIITLAKTKAAAAPAQKVEETTSSIEDELAELEDA